MNIWVELIKKGTLGLSDKWSFKRTCTPNWTGSEMLLLDWSFLLFHNWASSPEKPVCGVCDQVRLKPACSATKTSKHLEISDIETRGIILSKQQTTKALIGLRGCAGWSAPLLFAYGKNRFSDDVAHTQCVRTVKALAILRGRAGLPEPLLFAYVVSTIFSWACSFHVYKKKPENEDSWP